MATSTVLAASLGAALVVALAAFGVLVDRLLDRPGRHAHDDA